MQLSYANDDSHPPHHTCSQSKRAVAYAVRCGYVEGPATHGKETTERLLSYVYMYAMFMGNHGMPWKRRHLKHDVGDVYDAQTRGAT